MLSSNSSCNHNPNPNYRPFPENDTSSSTSNFEEDPYTSSFLFNFPNSPHMHLEYQDVYLQFLELFYQEQSVNFTDAADHIIIAPKMAADSKENAADTAAGNVKATSNQVDDQLIGSTRNMRSSKKDRHSKINTARGPRDRRMRLSLDIARKFFDLQDLLGYDKASRTVEWLLRNSGPAIRELARGQGVSDGAVGNNHLNPSSESSTCEEDFEVASSAVEEAKSVPTSNSGKIRTRSKKVKRVIGRATVEKESRRRARERARERTSQKRRLISESSEEPNLYGESVGLSHSFKESHVPIYDMQVADDQVEDQLPWNPSTVFNYQEENAVFLNSNEQTAEFQFSGEPWEAFNSFNLSG